jgi:hypothetical protein
MPLHPSMMPAVARSDLSADGRTRLKLSNPKRIHLWPAGVAMEMRQLLGSSYCCCPDGRKKR